MPKRRKNRGDNPSEKQALPGSADKQKVPSAKEIELWLIQRLSTRLHIPADDIEVQQPFTRYGLGSIEAIDLTADLEDWLGRRLPAALAWDYPTIASLAEYLGEQSPHVEYQEFVE